MSNRLWRRATGRWRQDSGRPQPWRWQHQGDHRLLPRRLRFAAVDRRRLHGRDGTAGVYGVIDQSALGGYVVRLSQW